MSQPKIGFIGLGLMGSAKGGIQMRAGKGAVWWWL